MQQTLETRQHFQDKNIGGIKVKICAIHIFKLHDKYCKLENFKRVLFSRSFAKIKPSQNREITLLVADVGKSCPSRKCLTWQICLVTLFTKIKFSQNF